MKLIHTAAAGLLLCAGLVSCELKEELSGTSSSSEIGYLDLSVAVNASQNVITKASSDDVSDDGTSSGSSVSADDFPVVITGVTDETYEKSFDSYADLVDESPIELPVGEYTVTAHSNLTLETQMTEPYYEGETESNLTITKDVTSSASVTCTMKNMRLQLSYSSEFTGNFTEWTITITDGSSVVVFTDEEGTNPDPIYWLVADEVEEITVTIRATRLDGVTVTEKRVLTKPSGSSSDYWTSGDALNISMDAIDDTETGASYGVSGITVTADVTFEDSEESVEVPVTVTTNTEDDETDNGNDDNSSSTGEAPVISIPQSVYTLPDDESANAIITITSSATGGLQSVYVSIKGGNDDFEGVIEEMGLSNVDLLNDTTMRAVLAQLGVTLPESGDTEYEFDLSPFYRLIDMYGTTDSTGHVFTITVTDANGTTTASVSVVVE